MWYSNDMFHHMFKAENKLTKKNATFMWYSNDMFHHMLKAEFVTLVSLKVLSGMTISQLQL